MKSINTPEMQVIIRWLREARESQGLTMRELGDRLGVAHSYVQKVEAGERRLDVVEFIWYCDALGLLPTEGIEMARKSARRVGR
ncbi:helix-turn-helix domain-containing protein [Pectobacterium actinidiae]|uniref:helix-turn-helix domain-containing protein n=1 Tax=Pectobacterium actinidiae TaxID=1507808 RepID=UPI004040C7AE